MLYGYPVVTSLSSKTSSSSNNIIQLLSYSNNLVSNPLYEYKIL